MKSLLILTLFSLASCAGMKSNYPEGIKVEKKIITKNDKMNNHGNAIDWIGLNFHNSNNVVKVNDKDRGKIVLRGLIDCSITNGGASVMTKFDLNLMVSSTDKQVILNMPNITSTDGWNYPRTEEQAEEVKACLNEKIISPLEKALTE